MNIKNRFPTEESLIQAIDTNLDLYVEQAKSSVGALETEYIKQSRARNFGIGLAIAGFLVAALPLYTFGIFGPTASFLFLLVGIVLVIYGWQKTRGTFAIISQFHIELNRCVYNIVFSMFEVQGELQTSMKAEAETLAVNLGIKSDKHNIHIEDLLSISELITQSRNKCMVDDVYSIEQKGSQLLFAELDVKNETGTGKERRVTDIFKGIFVSLQLPQMLQGKTFVSTQGDRHGFGHQSFLRSITEKGVQPTELEWNDFENLLHVVTSDPTEARYILTPNLMTDLHDWWKNKKQNIRIGFKEDAMYMLFPDEKIILGSTVSKIAPKEIKSYLQSVAIPLLHVLQIVEDVQVRFPE